MYNMSRKFKQCFDTLSLDLDCRVVMATGAGKNFTASKRENLKRFQRQ